MQENKKNQAENLRKIREINELDTVALLIRANGRGTSIVERSEGKGTRTERGI